MTNAQKSEEQTAISQVKKMIAESLTQKEYLEFCRIAGKLIAIRKL